MRAAHAQVDQSDESDDDVDESDDDVDVESTVEKYELASDNEQLSGDEEEVDELIATATDAVRHFHVYSHVHRY